MRSLAQGATRIRALFRGLLARADLGRKNAATVAIQARARGHAQVMQYRVNAVVLDLCVPTYTGLDGNGGGVPTPEVGPRQKPVEEGLNKRRCFRRQQCPCGAPSGPSLKGKGRGDFDQGLVLSSGWIGLSGVVLNCKRTCRAWRYFNFPLFSLQFAFELSLNTVDDFPH